MATISEIYNYVNAHNFKQIEIILSDENIVKNIKWNFIKYSKNIISRCVEVHATECFNLIIDYFENSNSDLIKLIDKQNIYKDAIQIAIENYINYQSLENKHFLEKLFLLLLDNNKLNVLSKLIKVSNCDIFLNFSKYINLQDKKIIIYLIEIAILSNNIEIFKFLIDNSLNFINDILDIIPNFIIKSINPEIFINLFSKYCDFPIEILYEYNFSSMSNECFCFIYKKLINLTYDELLNEKYNFLRDYNFSDYELNNIVYFLLKLPIKYNNLNDIIFNFKNHYNQNEINFFNNLLILFELRNDEMKIFFNNSDEIAKINSKFSYYPRYKFEFNYCLNFFVNKYLNIQLNLITDNYSYNKKIIILEDQYNNFKINLNKYFNKHFNYKKIKKNIKKNNDLEI